MTTVTSRRDRSPRPPALPPGGAARLLAADLVGGVFQGRLLDGLLDDGPLAARFEALEVKDRALVRAIVGVTLRRHGQIADALGRLIDRPLPQKAAALRAILAVGAAQVLFMDIPDHAAVGLAVDHAGRQPDTLKWKGLTNAVLRRLTRERDAILADQDEAVLNAPDWLFARWSRAYGRETARAIATGHLTEPSLDLSLRDDGGAFREQLGGLTLRPARCVSSPPAPWRPCPATRRARGGCRTRPPACRRGCSAT
ncbi:Ribosomal RNA small subunit methyltransferase B [Methylobrevis pamukkalensis]|uniref:Ribosomal RNA small subunit methyltransferase B n=1 Tax=Methylobrevis pamukkalensis TaxID=1439726 RepID=A0A1E3H8F0_9HYPH|nr:Ribosomal RNA small subunit methyltransferase B [Methylobrevis pamukkalensis]